MVLKYELFLLILFFLSKNLKAKKISHLIDNHISEIYLTIKGRGEQKICNIEPSGVIVNEIYRNDCKTTCDLDKEENNITLIFNETIESCYSMFDSLVNITKVDLSNFDTSLVTDMSFMFNFTENLENVNFGNINTSSLKSMNGLFQSCYNLKSIDLSNFDTSQVTDIRRMFNQCEKLEIIIVVYIILY